MLYKYYSIFTTPWDKGAINIPILQLVIKQDNTASA